jgi:transposase
MKRKHEIAIELKYAGKNNQDIAKQLQVRDSTVSRWFMKDGILHDAYNKHKSDTDKQIREESLNIRKRNLRNASVALVNFLNPESEPQQRITAARDILDREFGKAPEHIEHEGKIKTEGIIIYKPEKIKDE